MWSDSIVKNVVLGQYRGYRSEPDVAPDSVTPTFAALRVFGRVAYAGSLRERELGDVLDQAIALGVVERDDVRGAEVAYEAGVGILVRLGRLQADVGYRHLNVKGVNVPRIAAGAGLRF